MFDNGKCGRRSPVSRVPGARGTSWIRDVVTVIAAELAAVATIVAQLMAAPSVNDEMTSVALSIFIFPPPPMIPQADEPYDVVDMCDRATAVVQLGPGRSIQVACASAETTSTLSLTNTIGKTAPAINIPYALIRGE